jgi:2-iminobutanoate/2-iminopropanoate deaminase
MGELMAKRKPISGRGIPEHPQPFPAAVRVGNMIFSAGIGSQDAEAGSEPETPKGQVAQAFANMRRIVEAGGGQVGDIAKVVVYLNDRKDRDMVNVEWEKMFPDERDRPVRHTITTELPRKRVIQMEFIAVI